MKSIIVNFMIENINLRKFCFDVIVLELHFGESYHETVHLFGSEYLSSISMT